MDVSVACAPVWNWTAKRPIGIVHGWRTFQRSCFNAGILLMIAWACAVPSRAFAQAVPAVKPSPATSLAPLSNGWEQIDERLVFLTVRLSSDEASLAAVNKAIKQTGYQQTVKNDAADSYRHGNEIMDRKGGGPKPWDEFYGRTAEKFFYHPVDPNTVYINPIPISQRPPQLDYIYRANADEQQRAEGEAAALGGKIDKLLDRRRQLETDQSALWCEIAFQAIASHDLPMKPLYRFDLKTADTSPDSADHLEAARAACDFVRSVDQLMGDAQRAVESNPLEVFQQLPGAVTSARKTLNDRLSQQQSVTLDLGDPKSPVGRVAACAKRLDDLAVNILDSYRLASDGDLAGDDQRKDTFRGMLQDQLLSSAETLYTMDQCVLELAKDWKLVADVKVPAPEPTGHLTFDPPAGSPLGSRNPQQSIGPAVTPPQRGSIFDDSPATNGKADVPGQKPSVSVNLNVGGDNPPAINGSPGSSGSAEAGNQAQPPRVMPAASGWVDALPTAGTPVDQSNGNWEWRGQDLVGGAGNKWGSVFRLPVAPPASYSLRIEFAQLSKTGAFSVILPVGGNQCQLEVTGGWGKWAGIDLVGQSGGSADNPTRVASVLDNNLTHLCEIVVGTHSDQASISMSIDDAPFISWSGSSKSLAVHEPNVIRVVDRSSLGLDAWDGYAFHSVRVRTIADGTAIPEQPAAPKIALGNSAGLSGSPATSPPATTLELSGEQTDPVLVLAPRGKPYILSGDYDVPAGKRLEIRAGMVIVCASRSHFTVHGQLVCAGTQDHPIIFCGAEHSPAWWKGLVLDGAEGSSFTGTRFMDAELGVHIFRCNPTFDQCVFANNQIGLSIGQTSGYGGGSHAATLNDCVCSFNAGQGILVHGGTANLNGCTISKNGGWGIDGAYYVTLAVKNSIVSLNHSGGIILAAYDCKATAENSVMAGNTGLDLQNKSGPQCDLRGNYWGPALTQYFAGGGQAPPNIKGPARFEEPLQEMPKQCGASIRELGGQSLW